MLEPGQKCLYAKDMECESLSVHDDTYQMVKSLKHWPAGRYSLWLNMPNCKIMKVHIGDTKLTCFKHHEFVVCGLVAMMMIS